MSNSIQGLSKTHIETALTNIHQNPIEYKSMSMASYLPRLIQIAMSDIRGPRKLIRLGGSVLCDGRQMALGRKRKQGYKGWLTAQIYVAVARRRSSQEYMCDRLFTRPDPINAPTPTH